MLGIASGNREAIFKMPSRRGAHRYCPRGFPCCCDLAARMEHLEAPSAHAACGCRGIPGAAIGVLTMNAVAAVAIGCSLYGLHKLWRLWRRVLTARPSLSQPDSEPVN
jgi:hypothetical protein